MDHYFTIDEYEHVIPNVVFANDSGVRRKRDFFDDARDVQQFLRGHPGENRHVLQEGDSINWYHPRINTCCRGSVKHATIALEISAWDEAVLRGGVAYR